MDLESLDRRSFQRAIDKERERINSRPIELSAIQSAKSILESELKYLAGLREVATREEACELDAQLQGLRAKLTRMEAELLVRADEEKVGPEPDARSEAPGSNSGATALQNEATNYALMFNRVLEKRKRSGESKTAVFADWLKEHRGLSRTQVTDYLAGRVKRRVSASKREAIEAAILASAAKLGLTTRTSSD